MSYKNVPVSRLETPPKSKQEKNVISNTQLWRAVAFPLFGVSTGIGLYIKMKKPYAVSRAISMNKIVSLGSICAISAMEFYGENKMLANRLPNGYYKYQYSLLEPFKLTLTVDEMYKYWEENPIEFDWRFNRNALDSRPGEESKEVTEWLERSGKIKIVEKLDNPMWKDLLDFLNEKEA